MNDCNIQINTSAHYSKNNLNKLVFIKPDDNTGSEICFHAGATFHGPQELGEKRASE